MIGQYIGKEGAGRGLGKREGLYGFGVLGLPTIMQKLRCYRGLIEQQQVSNLFFFWIHYRLPSLIRIKEGNIMLDARLPVFQGNFGCNCYGSIIGPQAQHGLTVPLEIPRLQQKRSRLLQPVLLLREGCSQHLQSRNLGKFLGPRCIGLLTILDVEYPTLRVAIPCGSLARHDAQHLAQLSVAILLIEELDEVLILLYFRHLLHLLGKVQ